MPLSGWSVGEVVAVVGEVLVLLASLSGALIYVGDHKQQHKSLSADREETRKRVESQRIEDLKLIDKVDQRITDLWEEHDNRMEKCPVKQIEVKQDSIVGCIDEFRIELRHLNSKVEHLTSVQNMAVDQKNRLEVKLDTYAGKVDRVLGYLDQDRPGRSRD